MVVIKEWTSFLSKKVLIVLFLKHDINEIVVCRPAAELSYRNPAEPVYSIANLDLQSVRMMSQVMKSEKERLIKS